MPGITQFNDPEYLCKDLITKIYVFHIAIRFFLQKVSPEEQAYKDAIAAKRREMKEKREREEKEKQERLK